MTIPIGIQGSHFTPNVTTGAYEAGFKVEGNTETTLSITQANMGNVASGNMLVAFVYSEYDSKTGSWMGLPSGFTQRLSIWVYSGSSRFILGTKLAGGSEGTYTTSAGAAIYGSHFHLVEVSGATNLDTANISSDTEGFTTNDITIPSINVTTGGFVIGHFIKGINSKTITPSPGTTRLQYNGASFSSSVTFTDQMAASGATGVYTGDHDNASSNPQSGIFVVLN